MHHARKLQPLERQEGEVVAFPTARVAPALSFGEHDAPARFSLVVDLQAEPIGARWLRGAATLALLCGFALALAPDFRPLVPPAAPGPSVPNVQLSALALPPLPLEGPEAAAQSLPRARGLQVGESDGAKRISGDVSDGLYWSLRGAGASPDVAAAYLQAIATRIDVGEITPFDRFEFVLAKETGALIYAGLDRAHGSNVELLKWNVGGRTDWFDAGATPQSTSGLMAPVAGRITSRFGSRVHPILRFERFHAGIDFGAAWGSPVVAAADGQVVGAGWGGGYGRQVRVAHAGGLLTTYSHLSGIAAPAGTSVRQGQVIGYVGSTGMSTGPHLHFEVRVGGRAVDPLTARLVSRPALDGPQLAEFRARVKQLQSIPTKPA